MSLVRVGIDVWQQQIAWPALTECWTMADEAGVDNLWVCDHFRAFRGPEPEKEPIFEAWTALAAMAALTRRARIGVMVTGNTYRHPAILAKMAVTVDHASNGRLEFGLGAADAPAEHEMYGMPFPPAVERLHMLREALVLTKRLWTEEKVSLDGRFYKLADAICNPKPIQKLPPIWIGGEGEKLTLRIVAEHADVWNAIGRKPIEELAHKNSVLDEHCRAVGREVSAVRRSVQVHLEDGGLDVEGVADRMEQLVATGFSDFVVIVPAPDPRARLEQALKILLPRFQGQRVVARG